MNSFVLSRISMGEITSLEIPAVYMCSTPIFFLGWPNLQTRNQFLMKFSSVGIAGPPFFASSLCHDLFIQTFSKFSYQKFMALCMKYISWLVSYIEQMSNAMTANIKCIVTWLYVGKKRKNIFMASFYGWGSTASRLKPLRGGSLLFNTKFPEIPGTHFTNLRRMKV